MKRCRSSGWARRRWIVHLLNESVRHGRHGRSRRMVRLGGHRTKWNRGRISRIVTLHFRDDAFRLVADQRWTRPEHFVKACIRLLVRKGVWWQRRARHATVERHLIYGRT